MENTFEIGEIVVCVNARRNWYKLGGLKRDEMYTVVGFNPYDNGLILKEVKSPGSGCHAFAAERFRKVDYNFAENVLEELQPIEDSQTISEYQAQDFLNRNLN